MTADATPPQSRPRSRLTVPVRRDVLVDKTALRVMVARGRATDAEMFERVGREVDEALPLFEERGWLDDPASYHRPPTELTSLRARRTRSGNVRYSAWSWLHGFTCRPEEPGSDRYDAYERNHVARASVLEHRSGDRPWVVCVHGFGMGRPGLDLRGFRALHLHRDLGLNVALPVLPFHGARNPKGGRGLPEHPSGDCMDDIHGLAHGVWDVRQVLAHLRTKTSQPIALMGLSLGGCVAALVASLDDELAAAVLLVPVADLATVMADTAERYGRLDDETAILAKAAAPLLSVVSPLALEPKVPRDRRLIVAGTLDQFVTASSQAVRLWEHWDEPAVHWYHGGHISLFWAKGVQAALDDALERAGLTG